MIKSDTFCVNAYLNLNVDPNGIVKPCCMSKKEFVTDSGETKLNRASIMDFWNSKDKKKFIADLDSGTKLKECEACWKEENSGKESKRIRDNKNFQNQDLNKNMLPLVVDLSMGNLCNLKCRICSPTHSSQWMSEQAGIYFPTDKTKYFKLTRWKDSKESFNESNDFFWKDILALLPNVLKFDFAGGEPFYIDKHWNIIKMCVDNGWSKNQHIHYNTNGTIYPEKYIHLLEQFKIVDIQVSSDGIGEKFEYLRHPANWQTSEEVIDKLIKIRNSSNTEWLIGACLSLSVYNVYDIFETFEHYAAKDDVRIYINIVHDHSGSRILPEGLKKIIVDKLQNTQSKYKSSQWEKEKTMICNHLNNSSFNDYDWKNFWKEVKMRDAIRNESFEDTFPEYYNHMKNYIG